MNRRYQSLPVEPFDDTLLDHPEGAELAMLAAVRTWLRPRCDGRRAHQRWQDILCAAGLGAFGVEQFDLLMCSFGAVSTRPLDLRCRCATDLAGDEAMLLQAIALLQARKHEATIQLLGERLSPPATSGIAKLMHRLSIDLLRAGLEIRVRERHATYMH